MFVWMHRKDLPVPVARRVLPLVRAQRNQPEPFVAHPLDVVLLQKQYVWQTDIKCDPQVVLPHVLGLRFHTAQGYVPLLLRPPNRPDAENWLLCAQALLQTYPSGTMVRTVQYLQALSAGERGQSTDFPKLAWFESSRGRTDVEGRTCVAAGASQQLSAELRHEGNLPRAVRQKQSLRRRKLQSTCGVSLSPETDKL